MRASVLRPLSLALLLAAAACRRPAAPEPAAPPAPPLPIVSGELTVEGLQGRVTVVRDTSGIPHITASTEADLFFAQGFVQAQDRLFQMDLWRRSVQGRLSEVLGANFIERDAMTRRMQYQGSVDAEWAAYGPDARAIATAFTRGINAWIAHTRAQLPEEFALAGWEPEPWTPEDLLNRTEAFVSSAGAEDELFRARLASAVGVAAASKLLGDSGPSPAVSQTVDLSAINYFVGEILHRAGTPPFFSALLAPVPGRLRDVAPAAGPPLPLPERPASGLAFTVGRDRTASGQPLLAGSWVGPLDSPASRYLVHLTGPGWNVMGATAPWRPGVSIGHNERVAWSFTPLRMDSQDIFVERVNPDNPKQVAIPGGWRDLRVVNESVRVKGRKEPFDYEKLYSPHGVVIALDRQRHLAYTLRWSGFEPGTAPELGALALARAGSWTEFRAALEGWGQPIAEFVYADRDGRVAAQTAGRLPDRSVARGLLPQAGWTHDAAVPGRVTIDRLPHVIDPPAGVAVAAPGDPARRGRVLALLSSAAVTPDAARQVLGDVRSWNADRLVPLLTRLRPADPVVESGRQRLVTWDRVLSVESPAALLYVVWEHALTRRLATLRIPSSLIDEFVPRADRVLAAALLRPTAVWFDGDPQQARDRLLLDALAAAVDDERRWTGADGRAAWGHHQALTFAHPLGISERARRRYNAGPFPLPGDASSLFPTVRTKSDRSLGPTLRVTFDLSDWDRARGVVAPGQAAAPDSPYAGDLIEPWLDGRDVALPFSEAAIASAAASRLALVPPAPGGGAETRAPADRPEGVSSPDGSDSSRTPDAID